LEGIHFIVNPAAGRGRAARWTERLRELLAADGRPHEIGLTDGPGHAVKLAALAAREFETVVAVGGDGTVNEVVNGLRGTEVALGIVPLGSGNDFIRMLGIPENAEAALRIVLEGRSRRVDLGIVNERLFVNSIGIGLDAAVGRTMNRTRWLPGKLAYHYGILANIFFYRNRVIRWRADGEGGSVKSVLAAVMNGTTYGGGYRVAPRASCDDGLLDLVILGDYGVAGRVRHVPKLKTGRHLALPKLEYLQARRVRIESAHELPILVDGELLPDSGTGIEVEVEAVAGGLKVLAEPRPG